MQLANLEPLDLSETNSESLPTSFGNFTNSKGLDRIGTRKLMSLQDEIENFVDLIGNFQQGEPGIPVIPN